MGSRGPQPAPRRLRMLHGDEPPPEPVPSAVTPKPPAWLGRTARRVWERLAEDLHGRGVLTHWDVEAFASYCDAVTRRARAARKLDKQGEVVEQPVYDRNGNQAGTRVVRSPWWFVWKDADQAVQRWGARFGLTPSERGQVTFLTRTGSDDDDLLTSNADDYLTGGR